MHTHRMYASKDLRSSALWACRFCAKRAFQLAASLLSAFFRGTVSRDKEPIGATQEPSASAA